MNSKERMSTDAFDIVWEEWERKGSFEHDFLRHTETRGPYHDLIRSVLEPLESPIVLEVGCGTAIDSVLMAQEFPRARFVAMDLSKAGVRVARRAAGLRNISLNALAGDVFRLPVRTKSLDVVFSQGVIEHFQDPLPPLLEQERVLRPGGALIVNVPQRFTGYAVMKRWKMRQGVWDFGWETDFSARGLRVLGEGSGLVAEQMVGYGYWRSWSEPAWVVRDLAGKLARRLPGLKSFERVYDACWSVVESRAGKYFCQNLVILFRKPFFQK